MYEDNNSCFLNERFSFQVAFQSVDAEYTEIQVKVESDIRDFITIRLVKNVCVDYAARPIADEYVLSCGGEMLPDILQEIDELGIACRNRQWNSVFITVDGASAGEHVMKIGFYKPNGEKLGSTKYTLTVYDRALPQNELFYTDWLHYDSIANYYRVEVWSEDFLKIVREYVSSAVRHGATALYIPMFTPALDTAIGAERMTAQLIDVSRAENRWSFKFDRLIAFMHTVRGLGVRYFEMSHLFTQWGAAAAPKIVAECDGEKKRVFGWDTAFDSKEYTDFLKELLPALRQRLLKEELYNDCRWHLSDEPKCDAIERFSACAELVKSCMPDAVSCDALSDYDFYQKGIVDCPFVALNCSEKFIDNGATNYGVYYCTGQSNKYVSNRFITHPGERTRIIGMQLYLNDVKGLLHWGYNFWASYLSKKFIDPYCVNDACGTFQSGDAFVVYPGKNGPVDSIRHELMCSAMNDYRALKLLEQKIGRKEVCELLTENGLESNFYEYPHSALWLKELRQKING